MHVKLVALQFMAVHGRVVLASTVESCNLTCAQFLIYIENVCHRQEGCINTASPSGGMFDPALGGTVWISSCVALLFAVLHCIVSE